MNLFYILYVIFPISELFGSRGLLFLLTLAHDNPVSVCACVCLFWCVHIDRMIFGNLSPEKASICLS